MGKIVGHFNDVVQESWQHKDLSLPDPATMLWDPERFHHVGVMQQAIRNHGRIEIAEDRWHNRLVAVKAMPLWWARANHQEFVAAHPRENEHPWRDIAITDFLNQAPCSASVCECVGVFRRESEGRGEEICFVLSYCAGGDLLSWLGRERERVAACGGVGVGGEESARPLLRHLFRAVRDLHGLGIAHGDLSLENVLVGGHAPEPVGASLRPAVDSIRLIDFSASTGPRAIGLRGKPSYQAPEMYAGEEYDARAADAFALGVMLFTLATGSYPWRSTRPGICPCFRFFSSRGLDAYLTRRMLDCGGGKSVALAEFMSEDLASLLAGLLAFDPASRLTVAAALEHPWFSEDSGEDEQGSLDEQSDEQSDGIAPCWHGVLLTFWRQTALAEKALLLAQRLMLQPGRSDGKS